MEYYEVSFTYESAIDAEIINDVLASELGAIGFDSFTTSEKGLTAYIDADKFNIRTIDDCLTDFPLTGVVFYHTEKIIESRDWNEEWEKNYFKPIRIDDQCLIRASFHPAEDGFRYSVLIDPKMAFGTGNHATTYLMLRELLQTDLNGKETLDMGCGTGVLAILASMRGASRVVAIDIDEWACQNALENAQLNHTEKIEVARGDAGLIARFGQFDVIFANINRNILLEDIHLYAPALKPGGSLFMSGFYKTDVALIEAESAKNGLTLQTVSQWDKNEQAQAINGQSNDEQDDWVVVLVKKEMKDGIL
jgi:ribosomal protein L11 methyltransferase